MKIYKLTNGSTAVDMGSPNPIVVIPAEMWDKGFNKFTGTWWKCTAVKETTENDRVKFTLSVDDDTYTLDQIACFYHGVRDTQHQLWDEFEDDINNSSTSEEGYSYISINSDDNREWWEFHIYDKTIETQNQRPVPKFSNTFIEKEV